MRAPTSTDDAADAADIDLRCGGAPLRELGTTADTDTERVDPTGTAAGGTLLGKRYVLESVGIELLCTRGGAGSLAVGDEPLVVKGAKPLPSSD